MIRHKTSQVMVAALLVPLYFCVFGAAFASDNTRLVQSGFGIVAISTKPTGMTVILNGRYIGNSPIEEHKVAPGTHSVMVLGYGYYGKKLTFRIRNGQKMTISLPFATIPGKPVPKVKSEGEIRSEPDKTHEKKATHETTESKKDPKRRPATLGLFGYLYGGYHVDGPSVGINFGKLRVDEEDEFFGKDSLFGNPKFYLGFGFERRGFYIGKMEDVEGSNTEKRSRIVVKRSSLPLELGIRFNGWWSLTSVFKKNFVVLGIRFGPIIEGEFDDVEAKEIHQIDGGYSFGAYLRLLWISKTGFMLIGELASIVEEEYKLTSGVEGELRPGKLDSGGGFVSHIGLGHTL